MPSRWKVYVVMFTALMAAYAAYALWAYMRRQEHYSEPSTKSKKADRGDTDRDGNGNDDTDDDNGEDGNDDDGGDDAKGGDAKHDDLYHAKLYVMKVFDSNVHRKPTESEITRYSALGSHKKIYHAIMRDHRSDNVTNDGADTSHVDDDEHDDDHNAEYTKSSNKSTKTATNTKPKKPANEPEGYAAPSLHGGLHEDDEVDDGIPTSSIAKKGSKVCLDKADVLSRLSAISTDIKQFQRMVEMM